MNIRLVFCVIVGIPAMLTLGIVGCNRGPAASPAPGSSSGEAERPTVRVLEVVPGPVSWRTAATGTVEPGRRAFVSARVAGQVVSVSVEEGWPVDAGDVLCLLDDHEFFLRLESARARVTGDRAHLKKMEKGTRPEEIARLRGFLQAAESAFEDVKADEIRIRHLHNIGLLPDKELEDFLSRLSSASAGLVQASATLQLALAGYQEEDILQARAQLEADEASQRLAEEQLRHTTVITPMTGQVARRSIEPGEWVVPGRVLFEIIDQSWVRILTYIPEREVPKIRSGLRADITLIAVPGQVFHGEVELLGQELQTETRTLPVKIRLDNRDGRLKSGMFATVAIHHDPVHGCIIVPREVVTYRDRVPTVHVIEEGHVAVRAIRIGHRQGEVIEVVDGLRVGDLVLVSEIGGLSAGDPVIPLVQAASEVASASSRL